MRKQRLAGRLRLRMLLQREFELAMLERLLLQMLPPRKLLKPALVPPVCSMQVCADDDDRRWLQLGQPTPSAARARRLWLLGRCCPVQPLVDSWMRCCDS